MKYSNYIPKNTAESGQMLPIIAVLMIGMIAMIGLAIDGGGLMLLNRNVQNAADAAVVAGTYANCSGGSYSQVIHAAREAAAQQGFTHGVDGVTVNVNPNYRPRGTNNRDFDYVKIDINAPKESYFVQIVYSDPLNVEAGGVGRCEEETEGLYYDFTHFDVMIALGSDCPWNINATGNKMKFYGNIYSNGNMKVNGGGSGATIYGKVTYTGELNTNGLNIIPNRTPTDTDNPLDLDAFAPLYNVEDYQPGGYQAERAQRRGRYTSKTSSHTFKNEVMEGLYYVDGDVTLNQITVGWRGLTIVMTGSLHMSNNIKEQDFRAYVDGMNFFTTQVDHGCNASSGLQVAGKENRFRGTFYAPDSTIKVSGSENQICALVGYYINPSGSENTWGVPGGCCWVPINEPKGPPTMGIAQ